MAIDIKKGIELELQAGTRGIQGEKGEKGDPGNSYTPMIGNVETLSPEQQATVSIDIDSDLDIVYYNFGIPRGADSPDCVKTTDIIDNLTSTATNKVLSANQGKILNEGKIQTFDTVALMKAAELKNGMVAQTLGYYSVNDGGSATYKITNSTSLTDFQEELNNGLYATLIIKNDEVNSVQVGCKIEDNNFDNGPFFNKLLSIANNKGINVKILQGIYYVSTPIVINEKLYAITIDGGNPKSNENGTALIYTGTGYCLTLAQGGLKYTIKNLTILCNGTNSGINCDGSGSSIINFKNYLTNITVTNAIIGMKVVSSTYTFIDNYTFGGHANTEVGLEIAGYEFTYLNHCSIDGYSNTNENSIALKITGGLYYYIDNMDLCNFGKGKAIYMTDTTSNLYNVFYNNINIIRCDGGIVTEATAHDLTGIYYNNMIISLSGTNDNSHYFYSIKNSYAIENINISNLTIRNLASTYLPDYVYENATGGVYKVSLHIKDIYNCPLYKCGIKGGTFDQYYYRIDCIRMGGLKYITTDGTSTSYSLEIDYPKFTNPPYFTCYIVNRNDYRIGSPTYDNVNHKLKVSINFSTAPSYGNFKIGYTISNYGTEQ